MGIEVAEIFRLYGKEYRQKYCRIWFQVSVEDDIRRLLTRAAVASREDEELSSGQRTPPEKLRFSDHKLDSQP